MDRKLSFLFAAQQPSNLKVELESFPGNQKRKKKRHKHEEFYLNKGSTVANIRRNVGYPEPEEQANQQS